MTRLTRRQHESRRELTNVFDSANRLTTKPARHRKSVAKNTNLEQTERKREAGSAEPILANHHLRAVGMLSGVVGLVLAALAIAKRIRSRGTKKGLKIF
jgi:hypothetical protein